MSREELERKIEDLEQKIRELEEILEKSDVDTDPFRVV